MNEDGVDSDAVEEGFDLLKEILEGLGIQENTGKLFNLN
jgi:hypothetical protein